MALILQGEKFSSVRGRLLEVEIRVPYFHEVNAMEYLPHQGQQREARDNVDRHCKNFI